MSSRLEANEKQHHLNNKSNASAAKWDWSEAVTFVPLWISGSIPFTRTIGSMAERLIAPVLKIGVPTGTEGSNPSRSAWLFE